MAKNRVTRSLYRSLIKVARNFDSIPACKSLLYRTEIYHNHSSPAAKYYTNLLNRLFDKDSFLLKPKDDSISLVNLVREETRALKDDIATPDRLEAGFAALRKLSSLWSVYSNRDEDEEDDEEDDDDEEEDSSSADSSSAALDELEAYSLLKSDVTLSTALASGVLLVAHPMLQGPLHRSVILLLEHNSKGSYGVVINHRTGLSVDSSVMNLPDNILNVFGNNSVAFGGMVRRLTYLHDVPQVGGISIPTCKKPLFAGGEIAKAMMFVKEARNAAKAAAAAAATAAAVPSTNDNQGVSDGDVVRNSPEGSTNGYTATETVIEVDAAERFRFFVGCCLWEGGNLEKELASGYWIPTHSEPDVVLELAMVTAMIPDNSDDSDSETTVQVLPGGVEAIAKKKKSVASKAIESILNSEMSDVVKAIAGDVEDKLNASSTAVPLSQKVAKEGKEGKERKVEGEGDEEDEEEEEEDDERYSVDVWKALLRSLGEPYANMADIPSWVSAKEIESADWK